MDMETIGWIAAVWLMVSVAASLILGRMFRHTTTAMDESDLNEVMTRQRVVRYLRKRKPAVAADSKPAKSQDVAIKNTN